MKLVTFQVTPQGPPALGAMADDRVIDVVAVHRRETGSTAPALESMQALIDAGAAGLSLVQRCLEGARDEERHDLGRVTLLAPLPLPMQIRDCLCFEEHIRRSVEGMKRGGEAPPPMALAMLETVRRRPVWYKANRFAVVGPDVEIAWPKYSSVMDYECEMAAVIGTRGRDIPKEEAASHVFGYTIFNDFSARDLQMKEMAGRLGPAKSKDFDTGNVLGPYLVTPDEVPDPYALTMRARVNGEEWSHGSSREMHFRFEEILAYISRDETLYPGEFIGSGTVPSGCGLELDRWLKPGDVVELEVENLGVLRNRVTAPSRDNLSGSRASPRMN